MNDFLNNGVDFFQMRRRLANTSSHNTQESEKEINMNPYKKVSLRHVAAALLLVAGIGLSERSNAQLNPMGSAYYQNQYLLNPAMTGVTEGLQLNAGYRQQWTSMPGTPSTQVLTGDYGFGNRVGVGATVYNDKAGLLKRTGVAVTYAYHLPLSTEQEKLSFGLSLALAGQRIDYDDVSGDLGDSQISRFNDQPVQFDLHFGAAYSHKRLTVQAAIPGMRSALRKEDETYPADQSIYFTSVSYQWDFPHALNGLRLEPKLAFRGVRGFDNIVDVGANLEFYNDILSVMGVYHSSRSATYGVGVNYKSFTVLGMYTTQTHAMNGYASGNFELGLRFKVLADKAQSAP